MLYRAVVYSTSARKGQDYSFESIGMAVMGVVFN